MMRRFRHWALAVLAALVPSLAYAQVEVPFFFPVAVGGPVTKIIDGMAADFEKENPGIKVKPIYTGTYQDSITKALTAVKSGEPPVTSILLSTDMYTLIDEDAVVPFDDLVKTDDDRAMVKALNDERNPAMAERIDALHGEGQRLFVAVGALHMTGPKALPALLRARGFRVERVEFR